VIREPVSPAVILVVDDDEVIAQVVTRYLRHLGYHVLEASSGEQAWAIVRERQPAVDLVLCDVLLGASSGIQGTALAMAMFAECPSPQLILVAGPIPGVVDMLTIQGHLVPVLRKPLDLDELQDLLRVMLPTLLPVEECDTVSLAPASPFPHSHRASA
jgi:CheY-like chemotaxis protein